MSKFPGAKLKQTVWDNYLSKVRWEHAVVAALAIGVLLRLMHFSFGRMLWLDEAMVALNLQTRDGLELLAPLDFKQIAPIGWLLVEDWFVAIFQNFEYGARLPSLLASIASLFLFYRIAKSQFSRPVAFVSVFVFSTSYLLVYFSAELKPYAFDTLLWTMIAFVALNINRGEELSARLLALLSTVFILGSVLTMAAPAIVGGIAGVMIIRSWRSKDYRATGVLTLSAIVSASIFLFLSFTIYQSQVELGGLDTGGVGNYFNRLYAPFPPTNLSELIWYPQFLNDTAGVLFGVESAYGFLLLAILGGFALAKKNLWTLSVLVGPIVVGFILSALKLYPLMPRLVLYFIPIGILLACYALEVLVQRARELTLVSVMGALVIMCVGSLGLFRYENLFTPKSNAKDTSAEMAIMAQSIEPDEVIAVIAWSVAPFLFYRHQYGLDDKDWIILTNANCLYSSAFDLDQVPGVWLFKGRGDAAGLATLSPEITLWREGSPHFVTIERLEERLEHIRKGHPKADTPNNYGCSVSTNMDLFLFGGTPPMVVE